MTRYERRMWFEQLIEMRDAYRREAHKATSMTVTEAMSLGERLLDGQTEPEAPVADLNATASPTPQP